MEPGALAVLAAAGMAAGFVATLLGVGGGLLMVPVLHYGLDVPFRDATTLSLAAMVIPSASGLLQHARKGAVDVRIATGLMLGGAAGVAAGLWLEPRVPIDVLKLVFAGLMLLAAWRLATRLATRLDHRPTAPIVLGIGAVAGIASRLVGIGGGLVTGPLLAFDGVAIRIAIGSSLAAVFSNSILATAVALGHGAIDVPACLALAAGATAAGPLGTWAAHALHVDRLRRAFAGALVLAALAMTWRSLS